MSAEDNSPVPDYLKRGRVDGRNYVVLGGGLGMGRQTVHALSQAGASRVIVVDIDRARADGVAAEISGGLGWSGDITKRDEVKRLVTEAASAFGRVHGIVDIVGMAQWAALLDLSDSMLERDLDINFRHAFLASQEFARHMIDNGGGTMVFIASVSGKTSAPMHAGYGAAKAALMAWVQSLAVELGPHQIRANESAPTSSSKTSDLVIPPKGQPRHPRGSGQRGCASILSGLMRPPIGFPRDARGSGDTGRSGVRNRVRASRVGFTSFHSCR